MISGFSKATTAAQKVNPGNSLSLGVSDVHRSSDHDGAGSGSGDIEPVLGRNRGNPGTINPSLFGVVGPPANHLNDFIQDLGRPPQPNRFTNRHEFSSGKAVVVSRLVHPFTRYFCTKAFLTDRGRRIAPMRLHP
ncbi:hypothetical protein [Thiohalomonas denitrificans]|uniref:hypothetical protein n=1 Tax=Thiohalomonas denitrificans TaxID=415747 RepID=UPI00111337E8|nr:hypothetical protein [Thiohalomonas denitrificans]